MPHSNQWGKQGLYRRFYDVVNSHEVIEANLNLHGDPRFTEIQYVINDFAETTEFDTSCTEIDQIVAFDNVASLSNNRLRIAIIATLDSLLSWIDVYLEKMSCQPYECKIFDNLFDAHAWANEQPSRFSSEANDEHLK